jgi:hypothetical protein
MDWVESAMQEFVGRHKNVGNMFLYTDNGCCNGKLGGTFGEAGKSWKIKFRKVKLDGMHLMMRLHKCVPA